MKKKYIITFIGTLLFCLISCKKGSDYGDAVYITGLLSSTNIRFLVDGQSSIALTVSSTAKAETDIKAKMQITPELLDKLNASTGRNYQLPPTGSYSLDSSEVVIKAGKAVSTQIKVTADSKQLQEGISYCIPVSIISVEGEENILETSRTAYLMLTKVMDVKVAYLARKGCFDIPGFGGDNSPVKALGQMTLEMKALPISFDYISTLCGCEENFVFRFGDGAGNPDNKLQLSRGSIGAAIHPDQKDHYEFWIDKDFQAGRWFHLAAVYDGRYLRVYLNGEQVHSAETQGGTINLSTAFDGLFWTSTFAIGCSKGHGRLFDGYISECRVWNVARTPSELQDGVCYVDPTSKGLVAYWRFDGETQEDGSVLDVTGHGYNAVPYGTIQWVDNQKCPF